ncbi:MAG: flagellar biosynthetic protein FliR [Burkholderiaceae bacterium]
MNVEMLNILDKFYALIWPMLRISAFLVFTSVFSMRSVNMRIRISIALTFTIFLSFHIDIPTIDPLTVKGLMEISNQIFIGFVMGLMMQIATAAIVLAGQAVSGSMGLTMANMIDPTYGQVPVISQLFSLLGTLVFLSVGGHLIVFGLLLESFQVFPIGKSLMTQDVMGKMLTWSAMMFLAALLIALPVVVTLLFVNVGMGFVTRAAPSLNIFSVGFPAMLLAGFLILWMATPSILVRINWLWIQTFQQMRGILTG